MGDIATTPIYGGLGINGGKNQLAQPERRTARRGGSRPRRDSTRWDVGPILHAEHRY